MTSKPITKAVIAAAGSGTRFLPQTKAMPKEMLPLINKPIIQYIVEELVESGIQDIIIVTGYHKRSIEDHFDHTSADLRISLKQSGKIKLLKEVKKISDLANFAYVRQKGPYGTATPLMNVEHLVENEPFIYTFADDFVVAQPRRFQQIIDVQQKRGGSVLTCVERDADDDFAKYGYISGKEVEPGLTRTGKIVEKPGSRAKSPSSLATVSGYVIDPAIFKYLRQERAALTEGTEFAVQGAMQRMIEDGHDIWALQIKNGKHYDTGDKLEYIKAVIDFALQNDEIGGDVLDFLRKKVV